MRAGKTRQFPQAKKPHRTMIRVIQEDRQAGRQAGGQAGSQADRWTGRISKRRSPTGQWSEPGRQAGKAGSSRRRGPRGRQTDRQDKDRQDEDRLL